MPTWRMQKTPEHGHDETWFARCAGWSLYAGRRGRRKGEPVTGDGSYWQASVHRFNRLGGADGGTCPQRRVALEIAQADAEYFAQHGVWPRE